jgi:hypothetical protein
MCKQPVEPHSDAQASGDPPEKNRDWNNFPAQHEKRGDSAYVKNGHENGRVPVKAGVRIKIACFARIACFRVHLNSVKKYSAVSLMRLL